MRHILLILAVIILNNRVNAQSATCERNILENYKTEFITRSLSEGNREVTNGKNDQGEEVSIITYDQFQITSSGTPIIKEIVLTNYKNRITDFSFKFGSEVFEYGENYMNHPAYKKGKHYYHLTSTNILNDDCEAVYFKNKYIVAVNNAEVTGLLDADFDVTLDVSISVWQNFKEIEKEYNEKYTTRCIEELKEEGVNLFYTEHGFEFINEVVLAMVLKEREAVINKILKKYNSSFHFNYRKFIADPRPIWDEFYMDPIKYIKTIFENSHNLAVEEEEDVVIEQIKIGDNHAGGIVFKVDFSGKHGLVCAPKDQGVVEWDKAINLCLNLNLNGYSDWYLPSEPELNLMRENIGQGNGLGLDNIGNFNDYGYWSSTKGKSHLQDEAKGLSFGNGVQFEKSINTYSHVRAIRAF